MPLPTQDQLMGQLRVAIPAIGTVISAFGVSSTSVDHYTSIALALVGPLSYLVVVIWSFAANGKTSIVKSVSGMKETEVRASADGSKVTITTTDPTLVAAAKSVPQTTPPKE